MIFAIDSLVIVAADRKFSFGVGQSTEGVFVLELRFASEHFETDSFQARGRA